MEHSNKVSSDRISVKYFKVPTKSKQQFAKDCAVSSINGLTQWFPVCTPRIPRDPRPVPKGSVDTFP